MKIYLECYPCFVKQALNAGRFITDDELTVKRIVDAVSMKLPEIPAGATPPEIGGEIHRIIRNISGMKDPYRKAKDENIAEAIAQYPEMKTFVDEAPDRFATAARMAIVGNIIDYGTNRSFDISREIFELVNHSMEIDDTDALKSALQGAGNVLYIGDNAGETVFDKLFIEELTVPVTYVVRGIPVLNDATYEDAVASGLAEVCSAIISSGTQVPGTLLDECNDDFLELFRNADVVISKGQGNYESLSDVTRPIFFLLRAKCAVVAKDLGVEEGTLILKAANM